MKKALLIFLLLSLFSCAKQAGPVISGTYVLSTHIVEMDGKSETSFVVSVPSYETIYIKYGADPHDFFDCEYAEKSLPLSGGNFRVAVRGLKDSVDVVHIHNLRVMQQDDCVDTVRIIQYPPHTDNPETE